MPQGNICLIRNLLADASSSSKRWIIAFSATVFEAIGLDAAPIHILFTFPLARGSPKGVSQFFGGRYVNAGAALGDFVTLRL